MPNLLIRLPGNCSDAHTAALCQDGRIGTAALEPTGMAGVLRLKTLVDTREGADQTAQLSVSARVEAVLADGRRIVLLDDRGWTSKRSDGGDPWEFESGEGIRQEALTVVGPDEPTGDDDQVDADAEHWDALARVLRDAGVDVSGAELAAVPQEIELSDRVMTRIGKHQQ